LEDYSVHILYASYFPIHFFHMTYYTVIKIITIIFFVNNLQVSFVSNIYSISRCIVVTSAYYCIIVIVIICFFYFIIFKTLNSNSHSIIAKCYLFIHICITVILFICVFPSTDYFFLGTLGTCGYYQ